MAVVETACVSAAVTCHHCENAPCLSVCPVGVISRIDGAVCVDEQRCIGCKMCAIACPYGAINPSGTSIAGVAGTAFPTPRQTAALSPLLNWEIGVATCAVKCDMCQGVSDAPRCVDACLTGALVLVDKAMLEESACGKRVHAALMLDAMSVGSGKAGGPR